MKQRNLTMVEQCCVDGCVSINKDITYFKLPVSRILRRKWLDAINSSFKLTDNALVCSEHFAAESFVHVRGKRQLRPKVVPSVFQLISSEVNEEKIQPDSKIEKTGLEDREEKSETDHAIAVSNVEKAVDDRITDEGETERENLEVESSGTETILHKEGILPGDIVKDKILKDNENTNTEATIADKAEIEIDVKDISNESDKLIISNRESENKEDTKLDTEGNKKEELKDICDIIDSTDESLTLGDKAVDGSDGRGAERKDKRDLDGGYSGASSTQRCEESLQIADKDLYKDLEEVIKNYQIKQTRPLSELTRERDGDAGDGGDTGAGAGARRRDAVDYIEVEINDNKGLGPATDSKDCLMLLENVQVEIDPANLFLSDRDSDVQVEEVDLDSNSDVIDLGERKDLPVSLLTSSDEDEVIIQEPHIDTVEVSDATDEDDLPLLKLVKLKRKRNEKSTAIAKIMTRYQYECMKCQFATNNLALYKKHVTKHIQVSLHCKSCNFTTSSETAMNSHKIKHRCDKKSVRLVKKYKCPLCEYRAGHHMSLVYHLETHNKDFKKPSVSEKETASANYCPFCSFSATKKRDLRWHLRQIHFEDSEVQKVLSML